MNAQVQSIGELSVAERAVRAMSKAESEARLTELAESSKPLVAISSNVEREAVHEARMNLKDIRVRIEKVGKAAREDATAYSKAIIAEEKRLIGLIEPEETRLAAIQKEWDDRKERERQERIAAEQRRVETIQQRIVELRGNQMLSPSSGSVLIAQHIADLEAISVDDSFAEFRPQAEDAKTAALARFGAIHRAALDHEAEQQRIADERAELARLRQEAAERERLAKEAQAKADAEARAERDRLAAEARAKAEAEAAKVAEENRRQRELIEKERAENARNAAQDRAEAEAKAKADRDRIAAEEAAAKAVRDAEEQRIAQERAKLEAEKAAADKAKADEEAAKAVKGKKGRVKPPSREEILTVVCNGFGVSEPTARRYLSMHDWKQQ